MISFDGVSIIIERNDYMGGFYDWVGVQRTVVFALDEEERMPTGETLAEHREHCEAKSRETCPFERRAKELVENEDTVDRHEGRFKDIVLNKHNCF